MAVKKAKRVLGIVLNSVKNKPENFISSESKVRKIIAELQKAHSGQPDLWRHGIS